MGTQPSPPPIKKGAQQPPLFGLYLLWPNGRQSATAKLLYRLNIVDNMFLFMFSSLAYRLGSIQSDRVIKLRVRDLARWRPRGIVLHGNVTHSHIGLVRDITVADSQTV